MAITISSNTGSIQPEDIAELPCLPADTPDDVLRAELESKGVVHVRGVMARDLVLQMRQRFFEYVTPTGILKPGTKAVDGIFSRDELDPHDFVGPDNAGYIDRSGPDALYYKLLVELHKADWMHEFCDNIALRQMVHRLKPQYSEPFVYRRELIRTNMPGGTGTSTGVHYDQIFLRGASEDVLTAWVPIGDLLPQGGGLMYLEGSQKLGQETERNFEKMCAEKGMSKEESLSAFNSNMGRQGVLSTDAGDFGRKNGGRKWLVGNYQAGDAVFHHAYMIHASAANNDPEDRIRVSADLRFGDKDSGYDRRWQNPFDVGDNL